MKSHAFAAAVLLMPAAALAQNEVSHSFVELGYVAGQIDSAGADDLDFRGLDLELSTEFSEYIHGYALYSEGRVLGMDVDADMWGAGIGGQFRPSPTLSVYGRLGYLDVNGTATLGSVTSTASDDGYQAAIGIRYLVTERLELRGSAEYVDLDESGNEDFVTLGGDYFLTDVLAFSFELDVHDDAESVIVGARIYPGRDRQARRRR